MDETIGLLVDCFTIIYKEQKLSLQSNSIQMIRTVVDTLESKDSKWAGIEDTDTKEILLARLSTLLDDVSNGLELNKGSLVRDIVMAIVGDDLEDNSVYLAISDSFDIGDTKKEEKNIKELRKKVFGHLQRIRMTKFFKLHAKKTHNLPVGEALNKIIMEAKQELEEIEGGLAKPDESILGTINFDDIDDEAKLAQLEEDVYGERNVYSVGIQALNEALQGGARSGENIIVSSLSHGYKTGMTLSMWTGIAMFNKPILKDPSKKALALWVSGEDDIRILIDDLYQIIYPTVNDGAYSDPAKHSIRDKVSFVKHHLTRKGFHVAMDRIDPSKWTYLSIQDKVKYYEAQGYEVIVFGLDYLGKIPTIGCDRHGPTGSDKKDLMLRTRNFMAGRDIIFMSPWQLNSSAKDIKYSGIHKGLFVKEIAGRSMYQGNSTLDTEIDAEVIISPFKSNGKDWLSVGRGKHKLPSFLPDEKRFFYLPFPDKGYIHLDQEMEPIHARTLEEVESGTKDTGNSLF